MRQRPPAELAYHHRLCVYITSECTSCETAVSMAEEIRERFPQLVTEVIDLDDPRARKPGLVFAVPTYVLDGRVVSLGNPRREQIFEIIMTTLDGKMTG
ncbi:MAG: thioredoxin family protein [Acidobacteria bacterium]|nr:thioredoxin family protein [Acidobacteriota bacterium]